MKLSSKLLAAAVIAASTYSMSSCSAPATFSYKNVSISLSSFCSDCASNAFLNGGTIYNPSFPLPPAAGSILLGASGGLPGGTTVFVATVTNAPQNNVTWTIYPQGNLSDIKNLPTGTSTPVGESGNPSGSMVASGNTVYYTDPSGPPVYSGAALLQANQLGIPQGDVLLVASVPIDPANPSVVATQSQLIQVYGTSSPSAYLTPSSPTTPSGETQPVVTVPRNTSYAFTGGIVGALPCTSTTTCKGLPLNGTDNTAIWEVGPAPFALATAIPGGNSLYGTITPQGVYTAPATIPTSTNTFTTVNNEVVVYIISNNAPTVNSYAYVLIN